MKELKWQQCQNYGCQAYIGYIDDPQQPLVHITMNNPNSFVAVCNNGRVEVGQDLDELKNRLKKVV